MKTGFWSLRISSPISRSYPCRNLTHHNLVWTRPIQKRFKIYCCLYLLRVLLIALIAAKRFFLLWKSVVFTCKIALNIFNNTFDSAFAKTAISGSSNISNLFSHFLVLFHAKSTAKSFRSTFWNEADLFRFVLRVALVYLKQNTYP